MTVSPWGTFQVTMAECALSWVTDTFTGAAGTAEKQTHTHTHAQKYLSGTKSNTQETVRRGAFNNSTQCGQKYVDTWNILLPSSTARSFIWSSRKYVDTRGNSITGAPNYSFFQTMGFNWNHKGELQTGVVHTLLGAWCFCVQQDGNKRMRKLLFKRGIKNAETLLVTLKATQNNELHLQRNS